MVIRWSMREVTADLQREGTAQPFRTVGAVDALRAGAAELSAAGFEVERARKPTCSSPDCRPRWISW